MSEDSDESKQKKDITGLFIPAGLFLGMGIGWVFGLLVPGLFIGLGVGFAAMAIARMRVM